MPTSDSMQNKGCYLIGHSHVVVRGVKHPPASVAVHWQLLHTSHRGSWQGGEPWPTPRSLPVGTEKPGIRHTFLMPAGRWSARPSAGRTAHLGKPLIVRLRASRTVPQNVALYFRHSPSKGSKGSPLCDRHAEKGCGRLPDYSRAPGAPACENPPCTPCEDGK